MKFENKKKIIISIILAIIIGILFVIYIINSTKDEGILVDDLISKEEGVSNLEGENIDSESINNNKEDIEKINDNTLITKEEINNKIAVHIIGEVKKEGIVYLEEGARIIDAIEKAGGSTKEADLSQINLAYQLRDGQKIYVPNKKEKISTYIIEVNGEEIIQEGNSISNGTSKATDKVNINTANVSELDTLPGIGPSLAQQIVTYRKENGDFKSIEELQNVKGIGNAKYSDIKNMVTI